MSLRSLLVGFALLASSSTAFAGTITFESIASGTLIRDQLLSLGVRVIGPAVGGNFSGLVYSEGQYGVLNFGNSPPQVMDIGRREEPTTIQFVSPTDPTTILGVTSLSMRLGDGDLYLETFRVTYYDIAGNPLGSPVEYSTYIEGVTVSASSASLGALIGSVELRVLAGSPSGACVDDIDFTLATEPVPDAASTLLLFGASLAGLAAWRRLRT